MRRGGLAAGWTRRLGGIALAYALALAAILSPLAALDAMARSSGHGLCLSAGSPGADDAGGPTGAASCACPGLCQTLAALAPRGIALPLPAAWTRLPAGPALPLLVAPSRYPLFSARGPPGVVS